jgi:hypothetical protein
MCSAVQSAKAHGGRESRLESESEDGGFTEGRAAMPCNCSFSVSSVYSNAKDCFFICGVKREKSPLSWCPDLPAGLLVWVAHLVFGRGSMRGARGLSH